MKYNNEHYVNVIKYIKSNGMKISSKELLVVFNLKSNSAARSELTRMSYAFHGFAPLSCVKISKKIDRIRNVMEMMGLKISDSMIYARKFGQHHIKPLSKHKDNMGGTDVVMSFGEDKVKPNEPVVLETEDSSTILKYNGWVLVNSTGYWVNALNGPFAIAKPSGARYRRMFGKDSFRIIVISSLDKVNEYLSTKGLAVINDFGYTIFGVNFGDRNITELIRIGNMLIREYNHFHNIKIGEM